MTARCKPPAARGPGASLPHMLQLLNRPALAAALALVVAPLAGAAGPAPADETLPNEVALRAIDDHWGRAETDGDAAYLDPLLALEYRSIGPRGEVTPRAAMIEHARRRAGSAEAHRAVAAFKQGHPTELEAEGAGEPEPRKNKRRFAGRGRRRPTGVRSRGTTGRGVEGAAGHNGVGEGELDHGDGMSSSGGLCGIFPGELYLGWGTCRDEGGGLGG